MFSTSGFAQSAGIFIYFIQVVKFKSNPTTGWRIIQYSKPDFSKFVTRKDCEKELLKAISEPDSRVAKENGLFGEYVVKRTKVTKTLEVINDLGSLGYTKGKCVRKYLSSYDVKMMKKEWEKWNGMKLMEWNELGFRNIDGSTLPKNDTIDARLIAPDGIEGRLFLVYQNYKNLLYYNCSSYYAVSIGLLSDEINF